MGLHRTAEHTEPLKAARASPKLLVGLLLRSDGRVMFSRALCRASDHLVLDILEAVLRVGVDSSIRYEQRLEGLIGDALGLWREKKSVLLDNFLNEFSGEARLVSLRSAPCTYSNFVPAKAHFPLASAGVGGSARKGDDMLKSQMAENRKELNTSASCTKKLATSASCTRREL